MQQLADSAQDIGQGYQVMAGSARTPRSWMPALYVFSPTVADADFYSHFYPHQNLDVGVARELKRQKAQRLLDFSGNPFCLLELTGVLWSTCWRRGWDSNPRYLSVRLISSQVHSTTLPPLRVENGCFRKTAIVSELVCVAILWREDSIRG